MVAIDKSKDAKKLRSVLIMKLQSCTCLWPLTTYRNGSGHDGTCPVHIEYLAKRERDKNP